MRKVLLAGSMLFFALLAGPVSAQVVINEFEPANINGIVNSNASYNDWIELYNAGSSPVNLLDYGLSDDLTDPYAFRFPSYTLPSHGYVLVFAADTTNKIPVNHWENLITSGTTWKYFEGTSQPDTNWRNLSFNDAAWSSSNGGFGYGDGDDATTISSSARSVMMRKTFNLTSGDTANILKAILSVDYDDGFVAFLNGVEIARANLGVPGDRPLYSELAIVSHEAVMPPNSANGDPDSFFVKPTLLKSLLLPGQNVLAVQVHNQAVSSNDLTAKVYFHVGMKNAGMTFSNPSSWFGSYPPEYFSAKFKLTRSGETIYLTAPGGAQVDQQSFTAMLTDNSFGRNPDGAGSWCLMSTPTPLSTNNTSTCYVGYAIPPIFSIGPGFYPTQQTITLTNTTPGGVIRYTTNGDEPTTSSPVYTSPITLITPRTIRAKVFASSYLPSPTITNTYVIGDNIHLPVFSITTDSLNLWDYNTGIYVLGPNAQSNYPYKDANFWQDWTKQATIEYFDKGKSLLFNFNADISIYGNYSRAKPQKSFEINLKDKYGTGELNYSFLPDKPYIDKIDNLILRNSGTDWNVAHFRDAFMERVMKPTHSGYIATEPVVMYLNGSFWGVYTIHENHDHHWMKNNYGYTRDEVDYLRESGSTIEVKEGSDATFWESYNYATTHDTLSSDFYSDMSTYWDLDNYKDYFIAETYYDNGDWIGDWTNNIKMWRPNHQGGRMRYLLYDTDFGLGLQGSWTANTLQRAIHPSALSYSSKLFARMLGNPQFKREFINRYADLMNTVYKPSSMLPVMHQFQDSMSFDMQKHFAKWGSTMSDWQSNINVMANFINLRPGRMRNYIEAEFDLDGQVTLTFAVDPPAAGRIQVSTVIPETYPWTGVYFDGNPVTITAIPNPGYSFDRWNSNHNISNDHNQTTTYNFDHATETITAYFTGSSQPVQLVVSEFNYNSDSANDAEDWIELHNFGSTDLDLTGWKLKDEDENSEFVFPLGTVVPANGYMVVVQDTVKFAENYPSVSNFVGELGFNLGNGGDQIRIISPNGQVYLSFFYQDISPWPTQSDGFGFTNELTNTSANPGNGSSWFTGCIGGSPGQAYTAALATATELTGNTSFCPGGQTTLFINSTPGYTYQWQRNYVDIPGAIGVSHTTNQAGAYRVRILYQGCSGFSDTAMVSVGSGQPPVVSDQSRCGEGTLTFNATASDSIYWFDTPGGTILGTGNTFTTPLLSSSETYYVQVSLSCPTTPVAVQATVTLIPNTPVAADVSRCGPGPAVINATANAPVNWYNDLTNGALIYTGNVFVTGYLPHDTVFYAEAGNVCHSERVPVNVFVTSPATPEVDTAARCGPGSLVLNALSTAAVFWYDSVVAGNQVGSGINFLTPSLSESTVYYAEANNGCASARVPALAMINEIPVAPAGSDSTFCGEGSVNLYATAPVQIFWYDSPTGGTALASGSFFSTPVISTSTTFYAESFDICASVRTPIEAEILPAPQVNLGNDTMIATGAQVTLDAGPGFLSYQWSNGATTQSITVGGDETYSVAVEGSNGCFGHDTIVVSVILGIQQHSTLTSTVNLFPNPVRDVLNIEMNAEIPAHAEVLLMDITGKHLLRENVSLTAGKNVHTVNLSSYSKGIYYLRIQTDGFSKTMSFVVD